MPVDTSWLISEPGRLDFEAPIDELHVQLVNGAVNVVGTSEQVARVEVNSLQGPPLRVRRDKGRLEVAHRDLSWKGLLGSLDFTRRHHNAVISLLVPTHTRLNVSVLGAAATVSGLSGRAELRGVSGDCTLVGLAGPVSAETVSGSLETQRLTGTLRFSSVSGHLTVVESSGAAIRADTVCGNVILDLDPVPAGSDIGLSSVSGEIAIRLPHPTDATVTASTASGTVASAFEELRVTGWRGPQQITGTLGSGSGRLTASTVSGPLALLRRPPRDDDPHQPAMPHDRPSPVATPVFVKDV